MVATVRTMRVICYDVASDARRRRVADALEQVAVRVQYSVFEARLSDRQTHDLARGLKAMLDDGDRLRIYTLPRDAVARSLVHGGPPLPEEQDFWLM